MRELTIIQQAGQAPAAARAASAADAEAARLDAQLEVAAKKAALRSLEAQAGQPAAEAPLAPPSTGRIVIERDGKTIILDNPTAEQIAAVGGVGTVTPPVEGWALVALSGMVVGTIIIVTTLVLKHLRSRGQAQPGRNDAQAEARMARIENAIESIAEEVERISEGQRFAARILSEGSAQPVNAAPVPAAVLNNRGNS